MKYLIGFFLFFWTTLFLVSINQGLGDTPIRFNQTGEDTVKKILPQGWGFFSKNPREEEIMIYPVNQQANEVLFPTMRAENLFGIVRKGRSQAIEMGTVISNLEEESWFQCDKQSLNECEDKIMDVFFMENTNENPLLCGEYIITKEKTTPWSYSSFSEKDVTISQVAKGEIACSKN